VLSSITLIHSFVIGLFGRLPGMYFPQAAESAGGGTRKFMSESNMIRTAVAVAGCWDQEQRRPNPITGLVNIKSVCV
jgi:hypothetical protein